ncbi:MAG: hypothetical protein KDB00_02375, partial [Planctomycetales bacterium]|nr:hypothetical protein [Planctomycetales bacterium]
RGAINDDQPLIFGVGTVAEVVKTFADSGVRQKLLTSSATPNSNLGDAIARLVNIKNPCRLVHR